MGREGRPSSLRMRIDRVRRGFARRVNVLKLLAGAIFVAAAGTGLFLAF